MSFTVVAVLLNGAIGLVCMLVLFSLKSIKNCIAKQDRRNDKQDAQIEVIKAGFTECRQGCSREFATKEDWVREAGFSRKKLDEVATTMARLEGKLDVVDKLPQICGNIAAKVVTEMRNGAN